MLKISFLSVIEATIKAEEDITAVVTAAAASTSQPCMAPAEDGNTIYLVDGEELQHKKKKRKLELELLASQIETQQTFKSAGMCHRRKQNLEK